jgi:hypothetical protein
MERNKMIGWSLTIEGKQKPCQHDNQLTRSRFLFIYFSVQGSGVEQRTAEPTGGGQVSKGGFALPDFFTKWIEFILNAG